MVAAFAPPVLRQILDFVPNHMGVGGADNPLWLDVLEWGRTRPMRAGSTSIGSRTAAIFTKSCSSRARRSIRHRARRRQARAEARSKHGRARRLGLRRAQAADLSADVRRSARRRHPTLENLGDEFGALREWRPQVAVARPSSSASWPRPRAATIDVRVRARSRDRARQSPDDDGVRRALDAVIGKQYWRAAHFRVAGDDINYRRFFNINDLAGLESSCRRSSSTSTASCLELLRKGVVDGLRIDHIDGLLEPRAYLERLRSGARACGRARSSTSWSRRSSRAARRCPSRGPSSGTTGYEFAFRGARTARRPGERRQR